MNVPFLDLTKSCVSITSSVIGCAISSKYIVTAREPLDAALCHREPTRIAYKIVFEELTSEISILEVQEDLRKVTGLEASQFPVIADHYPKLGDMLGVLREAYYSLPQPRVRKAYMHEDANPHNTGIRYTEDYAIKGYHFVPGLSSVLISPEERRVHFLLNVGRMALPAGAPVFDSEGRLRAVVKCGFDLNRYSMPNRMESEIFEIIPTIREETQRRINV